MKFPFRFRIRTSHKIPIVGGLYQVLMLLEDDEHIKEMTRYFRERIEDHLVRGLPTELPRPRRPQRPSEEMTGFMVERK